jgi:hypothetical protein
MSQRLIIRIVLGLPLDKRDLDDLVKIAPELLDADLPPDAFLPLPFWAVIANHEVHEELRARWSAAVRAARERREGSTAALPGRAPENCPNADCPLRLQARLPDPGESKGEKGGADEGFVANLVQVPAPGRAPAKIFGTMTEQLRSRLKKGVKRVIVTDPYVHCDGAEDGTRGGHRALITFLTKLGLKQSSQFVLELTPAPKGGTDGQSLHDTPLGRKLVERFPAMVLKHHRPCSGGFHDRFYLVVDGSGNWDGLYGPSINGLASLAVVLVGELQEDSPAKRRLRSLLDSSQ